MMQFRHLLTRRNLLGLLALGIAAALLALAATWRPAIAPIAAPARSSFAPADVARGGDARQDRRLRGVPYG